jgi:cytochrome c553
MRTFLIAAIVVVAATSFQAHSQTATPPTRLGLCAACHGQNGHASMPGVPNLAGQRLDYLRDALGQYRDGRRNVPVMRAAIGPISAAELDQLARWYSVQSPQPRAKP